MRALRWALLAIAALAGLLVLLLAAALGLAHLEIRSIDPPLPAPDRLVAPPAGRADRSADWPVRLRWIDTARQVMPTSQVLALRDGEPDPPFAMSHPAFVVEWADGRIFLVDLGMDAASAVAFGAPLEALADAEPIEPLVAAAERLGDAVRRVRGVAFTHLHADHVAGVEALCRRRPRADGRIRWVRSAAQARGTNFTTRGPRATVDASPCLAPDGRAAQRPTESPPPPRTSRSCPHLPAGVRKGS